ncbi:MAG: T9SS type A sorting domain-containing protein, partial [Bacteroidales bacterium]|nr:T9SS type A sorting domain-containing protein [Bacteroidales bacterium]
DDGTWWKTEDGWQQTDLGGGAWLMQMLMYYDSGFPHFKVYRALCDGQDMELIARKLEVNSYLDGQWADLDDGLYKWGVSHVINGVESAISWSECLEKNTTGVEGNRFEAVVYPNPAKDYVKIEGTEVAEVQVYNALGQMVKIVRRTNEIEVADLVKGIYLLRITDAEGRNHTERLVVKE